MNLYLPLLKMPYMKDVRCIQYSAVVRHILKIWDVSFLCKRKVSILRFVNSIKTPYFCDAAAAAGVLLPHGSNMDK